MMSFLFGSGTAPGPASPPYNSGIHPSASLFRNDKYSDMTIICGGQKFKAHRAIVCPQNRVFDGVFSSGTSNLMVSRGNSIKLDDGDPDIIECMLQFFYTGTYSDGGEDPDEDGDAESTAEHVAYRYSIPDGTISTTTVEMMDYDGLMALQTVTPREDDQAGTGSRSESGRAPLGPGEAESSSITPLESQRLRRNLQVYFAAKKFGVDGLRKVARARFTRQVKADWAVNNLCFPEIVQEIFEKSRPMDPLREVVSKLIASRYRDVEFRGRMRPVLGRHSDLAVKVLDMVVENWERVESQLGS